MNNSQFRRLLIDTPRPQGDGTGKSPPAGTPKAVLGARKHSSIPMTPRQVGRGSVQSDFARQLAERNAKANPNKKARMSAPKGTKLAAGYIDRTKERTDEENNEIVQRIKALEESMKQGDIDRETFEKQVQEITGGDLGTTHLVKGLDRKLLERVRRGEDILAKEDNKEDEAEEEEAPEVEEAFDELAHEEVGPILRDKAEKKGEKLTTPLPVVGVKRSRNDILKELKRQREEAARAAAAEHEKRYPTLGPGFRKVNPKGETSRIETDEKGREVLIITGPDGKEKRKVKKQKIVEEAPPEVRYDLDDPDKPINMHNLPEPKEDSEDDDIFEGVGSNYNPLADLGDDDGDDSDEEEAEKAPETAVEVVDPPVGEHQSEETVVPPISEEKTDHTASSTVPAKRDYFSSITRGTSSENPSGVSLADATVRAALAKVRNLDENSTLLQNLSSDPNDPSSKEARLKKRAAELAASDRDMEDMDLGFGASRFDDAEEMEREGERVKFSQWKGLGTEGDDDDDDGEEGARGAKKQRKRGGKKRKGDKNNPDDVLKVMERQQEKKAKTLG
ncbi:hypothetical protein LEMA_P007340.1 [Plenodomus lingam JN3]|uniref:RED-like N-terminal domain-containing protein n=1 Tax=Leptosphaeria maculans (strain JN3 / isolate v23.1.3 / race Av1-4-5-6-7-8) TaxID=985895 RepID=E5AFF8_LEPMJ|nr:hypothetical protein LEMA_P007340.1 [Plenodomus lingam JN3]CBY01947.1 hypothetical protein LEMA_P007340.1 [Plenodomus lingam JN3]